MMDKSTMFSFSDNCDYLRITIADGLSMFFNENIYAPKETPIEFIGYGLKRQPFSIRGVAVPPESLLINMYCKMEMCRLYKYLNTPTKKLLYERYKDSSSTKRTALAGYNNGTFDFIGTLSTVRRTSNEDVFKICVSNVVFTDEQDRVLCDHCWCMITRDELVAAQVSHGDAFVFAGIIKQYKRYLNYRYIDDYGINIRRIYKS